MAGGRGLRRGGGPVSLAEAPGSWDNVYTKQVVVLDGRDLNLSKVQEKANDIKPSLRFLRGYASMREEDFVFNPEAVGAARYYFIILIEAAMNIANHFCVRILEKAPANYAESFLLLGKEA